MLPRASAPTLPRPRGVSGPQKPINDPHSHSLQVTVHHNLRKKIQVVGRSHGPSTCVFFALLPLLHCPLPLPPATRTLLSFARLRFLGLRRRRRGTGVFTHTYTGPHSPPPPPKRLGGVFSDFFPPPPLSYKSPSLKIPPLQCERDARRHVLLSIAPYM